MSKGGFDALKRTIIQTVAENIEELEEMARGDTPIEKLFYAGLYSRFKYGSTEYDGIYTFYEGASDDLRKNVFASESHRNYLIVDRQVAVGRYRADFVISAWCWGRIWVPGRGAEVREPYWRKLVVECDGHEFHDRTKQQVARDKARDRAFHLAGYDLFRFSGSEIWRDPWECADQVYHWATMGI